MLEKILEIQDILEMWDVNLVDSKKINDLIIELLKENQELKKQLEEKNKKYIPGEYATETFIKTIDENILLKNQQKNFIKYLEDEIKLYDNDIQTFSKNYNVYFSLINDLKVGKGRTKDILQKYEEIIGV